MAGQARGLGPGHAAPARDGRGQLVPGRAGAADRWRAKAWLHRGNSRHPAESPWQYGLLRLFGWGAGFAVLSWLDEQQDLPGRLALEGLCALALLVVAGWCRPALGLGRHRPARVLDEVLAEPSAPGNGG